MSRAITPVLCAVFFFSLTIITSRADDVKPIVSTHHESLCREGEHVVLSAQVHALNAKGAPVGPQQLVSLCADRQQEPFQTLAYRFGNVGTTDITVVATPSQKFMIADEGYDPHSGADIIWFSRGPFNYYVSHNTGQALGVEVFVFKNGVRIADFSTGFDDTKFFSEVEMDFDQVKSPIFIKRPPNDNLLDAAAAVQDAPDSQPYYFVANANPPDAYLALRTAPSSSYGQRIETMLNGTMLKVLQRHPDGWWLVRNVLTGHQGWAMSGQGATTWIECCTRADGVPNNEVAPDSNVPTLDNADGFTTPSRNIYCRYFDDGSGDSPDPAIRCDIRERSATLPRPNDCDLEWGDAVQITSRGEAGTWVCHGDTTVDDDLLVLPYGSAWKHGRLACTSDPKGLTCLNPNGHGFRLSKATQQVF
jgi:hypothetical protein